MPITTRSRRQPPAAVPVTSTPTIPAKKNSKTTKTTEKALAIDPDGVLSEDDVPLASVKAKATAKTKSSTVTKPASKKTSKTVRKAPPKPPGNCTFIINQEENDSSANEEPNEAPKINSRVTKKNAEPKSPIDEDDTMEEICEDEPKAKVAQQKRKPVVNRIKVTSKQQYAEIDLAEELSPDVTSSKRGKEPVSRNEIRDILSETVLIEPKKGLVNNVVKKAQKGKPAASKKAELTTSAQQESEDEENYIESPDMTNPFKKVQKKPVVLEDHDLSEDQSDSAEEQLEPDAKVSKRGEPKKKKIPVIEESESEEYQTDSENLEGEDEQFESESSVAKKGAKKKELSADNVDAIDSPQKIGAVKKPKKLPQKAPTKKGVSKAVADIQEVSKVVNQAAEGLSEIMSNLDLGSKKDKKKKIPTKAKPKASKTKTKHAKEVDSEPEVGTLTKFSSTESLKNVTMRGVGRSQSEDNLNSMTPAMLSKPLGRRAPRAISAKVTNVESEEEKTAAAKKTKAPRKKAVK